MIDHEALYQLLYEKQWAALLDAVHRHHEAIAADALLGRAVETFVTSFFEHLAADGPASHADALEKLFLLHTGGNPSRFQGMPTSPETWMVSRLRGNDFPKTHQHIQEHYPHSNIEI